MQRFAASAASVSEFCAREGLSASAFYRWRARLAAEQASSAVARTRRAGAPATTPASVGFIELADLAVPPHEVCPGLELRLDLGGGVVLQIVRR